MPDAGLSVLVVSLSARALAGSARRAGARVHAVDLFADTDTRALCVAAATATPHRFGFHAEALYEAADRVDPHRRAMVVYGSGFDGAPAQLEALAATRPIAGNAPDVVRSVCDPFAFAALLERTGIPHPEVQSVFPDARPAADAGAPPAGHTPRSAGSVAWLEKHGGACGGSHVRPVARADRATDSDIEVGTYYQRMVCGESLAATVLADASSARVLGFARQFCRGGATAPFTFAGAVALRPGAIHPVVRAGVADAATTLVARLGLRGLLSFDFVARDDDWWLLEVNPRPGANFILHEIRSGLVGLHVDAACGRMRGRLPDGPRTVRAYRVVNARAELSIPTAPRWPRWVSDRPAAGSGVGAGEPLCTVHASAGSTGAADRMLAARHDLLDDLIFRWGTA